jgi:RNA polymerase sigma-70 factor, ECF subfamily
MAQRSNAHQAHCLAARIKQISDGDRSAEAALCEVLLPGLRILAKRRSNGHECEDVAHDAILVVLEAIRNGKLRSANAIVAFARGVVKRVATKQLKQVIQARANNSSDHLPFLVSPCSTPEQSAATREELSLARRVLEELTPNEREILRRLYLEEQSAEQICACMGLTITQFRLAKSRARAKFGQLGQQQAEGKAPQTRLVVVRRSS